MIVSGNALNVLLTALSDLVLNYLIKMYSPPCISQDVQFGPTINYDKNMLTVRNNDRPIQPIDLIVDAEKPSL